QVPGAHARSLRDVYRRRVEFCPVAVRVLSESPVAGVDVLDLRFSHAGHGGVCLLRHSTTIAPEAARTGTELRRIPVRQRRTRAAVRGARSGTAAGLVALRRVHGAPHDRGLLPSLRGDSSPEAGEPAGGSSLPPQMEHARPRIRYLWLSLLPACDRTGHSADARRPWIRRGSNRSSRVVDGRSGDVSRNLRRLPVEQGSRL